MMSVVYIYQFFRYFLRGQTNLKLREFEWIFLIRNSWLRSSFSKWNTRLRLWYLPPVTLFNFKFSSVIKLCICFYIWLRRIVWVRCTLVHDQLDGHSSREKSNQHLVFYGEGPNRTLPSFAKARNRAGTSGTKIGWKMWHSVQLELTVCGTRSVWSGNRSVDHQSFMILWHLSSSWNFDNSELYW